MILDEKLLSLEERMAFALRFLFEKEGYERFRMGQFEPYDLYVRNKDFLLSDRVLTFTDLDGRLMALKPDVTLSILRRAENMPGDVQKVYYQENVYRAKPSGTGFREIMQCGLECIGDLKPQERFRVVHLATESLSLLGRDHRLLVSHAGFLKGLLSSLNIGAERYEGVLDCIRARNAEGLSRISDDYGLCKDEKERLVSAALYYGPLAQAEDHLSGFVQNEEMRRAVEELKALAAYLTESGSAETVRLDFSVANHMGYYDGLVFKGFLNGVPVGVLSGGQYGGLLKKMGKEGQAIGFAVYLNELEHLNG